MADRFGALRVFECAARRGSFSRAARQLGLSQPSVSRILADLERDVGVKLLARSTRGLRLTEAGADYLARIDPILQALDEADHAARGTGELRGRLRIALSSSFGVREIIPRLPAFASRHPALRIDLAISDAHQNLIAEAVDVALRLGDLPDSNAVARRLGESPRLLSAAPAYLERAGIPASPDELSSHSVILGPGTATRTLSFRKRTRVRSVRVDGQLTVAANEGATAAAVAGLGITATSLWGCRAEIERGALVQVLSDWKMEPVPLHAVFPPGRAITVAARAFVDYLGTCFDG